jgi:hypothetical protein
MGRNKRDNVWYRQAKETKRGEMGGKNSERLAVPLSQGNHPRDPAEGNCPRLGTETVRIPVSFRACRSAGADEDHGRDLL